MNRSGFIWKFFQAINPISYDKLAMDHLVDAALYVPKILLSAFVIMLVISAPLLYGMPSYVDNLLSKTKDISISVNIENDVPINIPEKSPLITIDKNANISSGFNSKILISNDSVALKPMMCQILPITCPLYDFGNVKVEKNLGGYSNVLSHKDFYTMFLTGLFFMMLPAILLMAYIMFLLKYFAIALIFSILAFAITRMARFEIHFGEVLKISFYATTLMILIEIIAIPLPIRLYYAHLAAFLIYAVLGILRTGYHDRAPRRKIKRQRGHYVEMHGGHSGHGGMGQDDMY